MGRPALVSVLAFAFAAALGVAASASLASSRALDDGCLVTRDVKGTVTINLKSGFVLGRFDQGRVSIDDRVDGDGTIKVSGADKAPRELSDTKTLYIGDNLRFRATGRLIIVIKAVGVYVTAIGRGSATLSASILGSPYSQEADSGYSVDSASFCSDEATFEQMPSALAKFAIGGTT